jgi:hypothetical protein
MNRPSLRERLFHLGRWFLALSALFTCDGQSESKPSLRHGTIGRRAGVLPRNRRVMSTERRKLRVG